jgi:hypothetical protein
LSKMIKEIMNNNKNIKENWILQIAMKL